MNAKILLSVPKAFANLLNTLKKKKKWGWGAHPSEPSAEMQTWRDSSAPLAQQALCREQADLDKEPGFCSSADKD